ncbi:MAG: hypothetical protein IJG80_07665 [Selenomonadaceae bacterium]|nr:hypothetical protein [Selenomonadaceae bacterium]MBQ3727309.1 hypothetical protein [Selenomonadaceae bacterium]MBQ9497584.1 hypothetical protein [Selenomonadaceae bacterium]
MGRFDTSGTSNGTSGSPQMSLEQEQLASDMTQAEQVLIQETDEMLFAQLDREKIKYTRENVLFITRDTTGQIVFLETGTNGAGFKHIVERHAKNFKEAFNIDAEQIPMYLKNVVRYGNVISNEIVIRNGKKGFERKYYYNGEYQVVTGIGLNGFIVSAYPREILR